MATLEAHGFTRLSMEANKQVQTKRKERFVIENIHDNVNNGFCEHAKELWFKSAIKQKDILLTKATQVCEIDGSTCINWNKECRKSCPTLRLHILERENLK